MKRVAIILHSKDDVATALTALEAGQTIHTSLEEIDYTTPLLEAIDKQDINNLNELTKGITPIYPIARRILNLENKILSLRG